MKSTTYGIFIGIVMVFFTLLFYVPNETNFETVQIQDSDTLEEEVLGEDEEIVVPENTKSETVKVEEMQKMTVVEEKVEIIGEISDEVTTPQPETIQTEEIIQVSFSKINEVTRDAIVNIFCTTKSGGSFKPITGSGVVIDKRGIILTNAHVAQYFLLKNYITEDFLNCVIRTGSPAQPRYKAEPIFISPSWVKANANGIIQQSPKGTGEDDYALLLMTERTDSTKTIPETFPFIPPLYNSGDITVGDKILLAGYPAGFLSGIVISKNLYISSAVTEVIELFTFKEGTLDLFSIGGSVVAQQGSSGGAVVNDKNELLGIIVTSSVAENTQDRDLRAITIAHINRSFVRDTGFDLQTLFSGNMTAEAQAFNENIATNLTQLLVGELEKNKR